MHHAILSNASGRSEARQESERSGASADNIVTYLDSLRRCDVRELYLSFNGLTYIPSLLGFTVLRELNCDFNSIMELPPLPDTLIVLSCNDCYISELGALPPNLTSLHCTRNMLAALPESISALPLRKLYCDHNFLQRIPKLPVMLEILHCNNNAISRLPDLPSRLLHLSCYDNYIMHLPHLPCTVNYICVDDCYDNFYAFFDEDEDCVRLRCAINVIAQFRKNYYTWKYAGVFLRRLWGVRRRIAMRDYHPDVIRRVVCDVVPENLEHVLERFWGPF